LTDDMTLGKELGTRHRAAIGISEQTDAIIVVVSEETGIISVAQGGHLTRYVEPARLKDFLRPLYYSKSTPFSDFFNWRSSS
jgi:diadenylate cyclase